MGNAMIQSAVILAAVLAGLIAAMSLAAQQKPQKPDDKPVKKQVQVDVKRIKGPKSDGKADREFPVMFDIAGKAKAAKSKRTHAPKR